MSYVSASPVSVNYGLPITREIKGGTKIIPVYEDELRKNDVVYTTVVSSSETQVVLPATLSGEYQIELAMGGWLFTGWITLY